jgi:hypothetical protein
MSPRILRLVLALAGLASPAVAGSADVVAVEVVATAPGLYRFDVTVHHPDTGWDHYADKWEILAPDGRLLGTRILLHPHVDEQPFTRSLDRVRIPGDVRQIVVRAHDNVDGYGNVSQSVEIRHLTE